MNVTIKRIDKTLPLPEYATAGSCGFDMYSRTDMTIAPHQIALIPSNLIVATPKDYVFMIVPRSSLPRKKGLIMPHSIGIIDQDYCGEDDETMIQVQNATDHPVEVARGERIAQGLFMKIAVAQWQETDTMSTNNRGGLGSTAGYTNSPEIHEEQS